MRRSSNNYIFVSELLERAVELIESNNSCDDIKIIEDLDRIIFALQERAGDEQ